MNKFKLNYTSELFPLIFTHPSKSITLIYSSCYLSPLASYLNPKYFSIAHSRLFDIVVNEHYLNLISHIYISGKNKTIPIHYYIYQFNFTYFTRILYPKIPKGFLYSVFIKVRYNEDSFFMAGNQFGFDFSTEADV